MTKKELQLITDAIKAAFNYARVSDFDQLGHATVGVTIALDHIAEALERDNPKFNKRKFFDACAP